MERAHDTHPHDLPINVPEPLVETTRVGNQEGKALASGSAHSDDEKNHAYVTDLEASRSPSQEQEERVDEDSGSLANRLKSFHRSRAYAVMRDFAWIGLLVSALPGITHLA